MFPKKNDNMKRSVSLIILVAGTLLASCSSLQTISFDQLQAADVSFPDAVRKVAVINNMPVLKTKDNHEILSSELEGDGKVASEALAENIAKCELFSPIRSLSVILYSGHRIKCHGLMSF